MHKEHAENTQFSTVNRVEALIPEGAGVAGWKLLCGAVRTDGHTKRQHRVVCSAPGAPAPPGGSLVEPGQLPHWPGSLGAATWKASSPSIGATEGRLCIGSAAD